MTLLSGLPKPTGHLFLHLKEGNMPGLRHYGSKLKKKNIVPAFKGLGKQMQPENDDNER